MLSSLRSPIPVLLSLLLGLPILFSGCRSFPGDDPPLPDSTFTRVLVDLHLTTARGERLSSLPSGIEDSVFARHGVRREEVDATLRYYARQPEDLETLYNGVIDTLSALQTRLRSRQDTTEEESEAP